MSAKLLATEELAQRLRAACAEAGGQSAWAAAHGVDPGQLSRVLKGKEAISDNIAERMGFQKRWVANPTAFDERSNGR